MEIIHLVLGKANPNRLNGVNKVVYQMATEQSKAGKKVSLWGITKKPEHDYPIRSFETRLFKASRNPFNINRQLKIAIRQNSRAVFHLHGGWVPLFSSIARFFRANGIRFVLTPHGAYNTVAMKKSSIVKKVYFQLFEKILLNHAEKIHSIGASEVEGLQVIYPNNKSFLLPYGFEIPEQYESTEKNKFFTIGYVGRLDTHTKGLDLLLKAFQVFRKTETDSVLWIIGDGPGRSYIEGFIKENKLKNVILWGKKFGKEKDTLIAQMHVFAHPSRNEGMPSAVLEAASFGVPSIVSMATNVGNYIKDFDAGMAIANESVDELEHSMHTIKQMYDNHQAEAYSANCHRMLNETFGWQLLVHKFDELYQ
jgi:glycosyltransferase involved in cell wall biosynthesis